jgi:DNA-binding Xre family transcriptional regulator
MAVNQDCFKIEKKLKEEAKELAKAKGMSRSTLYRLAIIEFIERNKK